MTGRRPLTLRPPAGQVGGLNGFMQDLVTEVLAVVRAHVTALGGNALVSYFMSQCVLLPNPHKNQVRQPSTLAVSLSIHRPDCHGSSTTLDDSLRLLDPTIWSKFTVHLQTGQILTRQVPIRCFPLIQLEQTLSLVQYLTDACLSPRLSVW